jgi:recombination DNA repair RAD52 pathway protein
MAFTDEQREALKAKLRVRHVRSRLSNGATIPYVEGYTSLPRANRIFGYDCWDRKTPRRAVSGARASGDRRCVSIPPRCASR